MRVARVNYLLLVLAPLLLAAASPPLRTSVRGIVEVPIPLPDWKAPAYSVQVRVDISPEALVLPIDVVAPRGCLVALGPLGARTGLKLAMSCGAPRFLVGMVVGLRLHALKRGRVLVRAHGCEVDERPVPCAVDRHVNIY